MKALELTDYFVYDEANERILCFINGDVIFYGNKEEAEEDCYAHESVVSYNELPPKLKEVIENELKKKNRW